MAEAKPKLASHGQATLALLYVGSPELFDRCVVDGRMPKPFRTKAIRGHRKIRTAVDGERRPIGRLHVRTTDDALIIVARGEKEDLGGLSA
jgi:hypothetical protein